MVVVVSQIFANFLFCLLGRNIVNCLTTLTTLIFWTENGTETINEGIDLIGVVMTPQAVGILKIVYVRLVHLFSAMSKTIPTCTSACVHF